MDFATIWDDMRKDWPKVGDCVGRRRVTRVFDNGVVLYGTREDGIESMGTYETTVAEWIEYAGDKDSEVFSKRLTFWDRVWENFGWN